MKPQFRKFRAQQEVLNRNFEAFREPIEISNRSTKLFIRVELGLLGLPDAFKTSLEATVFILEAYEHLSIRRSIEDNLLFRNAINLPCRRC